jgi:hypothetical protein
MRGPEADNLRPPSLIPEGSSRREPKAPNAPRPPWGAAGVGGDETSPAIRKPSVESTGKQRENRGAEKPVPQQGSTATTGATTRCRPRRPSSPLPRPSSSSPTPRPSRSGPPPRRQRRLGDAHVARLARRRLRRHAPSGIAGSGPTGRRRSTSSTSPHVAPPPRPSGHRVRRHDGSDGSATAVRARIASGTSPDAASSPARRP